MDTVKVMVLAIVNGNMFDAVIHAEGGKADAKQKENHGLILCGL